MPIDKEELEAAVKELVRLITEDPFVITATTGLKAQLVANGMSAADAQTLIDAEIADYVNDLFDAATDETHILEIRDYTAAEVGTLLTPAPIMEILKDISSGDRFVFDAADTKVYYTAHQAEIQQDLITRFVEIYAEEHHAEIVTSTTQGATTAEQFIDLVVNNDHDYVVITNTNGVLGIDTHHGMNIQAPEVATKEAERVAGTATADEVATVQDTANAANKFYTTTDYANFVATAKELIINSNLGKVFDAYLAIGQKAPAPVGSPAASAFVTETPTDLAEFMTLYFEA